MATKSPLKTVNTRQRTWATEDGTWTRKDVPMYLDARGTPAFVFQVPAYIVEAFGVKDVVSAPTAEAAQNAWDALVMRYVEHCKTAVAKPVLLVKIKYRGRDAEGRLLSKDEDAFGNETDPCMVSLGYVRAFNVNGHIHNAARRKIPGTIFCTQIHPNDIKDAVPGSRNPYPRGIELPWTPELEAQLVAIQATISRAAIALDEILKAGDVGAALLGLGQGLLSAPAEVKQ